MSNNDKTLADMAMEAQARLRRINADQVFVSEFIDRMFKEVVSRDSIIEELKKSQAAEESPAG